MPAFLYQGITSEEGERERKEPASPLHISVLFPFPHHKSFFSSCLSTIVTESLCGEKFGISELLKSKFAKQMCSFFTYTWKKCILSSLHLYPLSPFLSQSYLDLCIPIPNYLYSKLFPEELRQQG